MVQIKGMQEEEYNMTGGLKTFQKDFSSKDLPPYLETVSL
jgi:hypothetical protein